MVVENGPAFQPNAVGLRMGPWSAARLSDPPCAVRPSGPPFAGGLVGTGRQNDGDRLRAAAVPVTRVPPEGGRRLRGL